MPRRTLAFLLIFAGLLALGAAIFWTFYPGAKPATISGPTPMMKTKTNPSASTPGSPVAAQPFTPPPAAVTPEERAQQMVKQRALQMAARQGTYASTDGFAALQTLSVEASPSVRLWLDDQRKNLRQAHPAKISWGQTTKALSARITSALPIINQTQVDVTVQAQQIIETPGMQPDISYREIVVTLERQGSSWIVARIVSNPLTL